MSIFQSIHEKAKHFFIHVYEYQNGVNLYGNMPLSKDSKQYKKAKKTTMLYFQNRGELTAYEHVKNNF